MSFQPCLLEEQTDYVILSKALIESKRASKLTFFHVRYVMLLARREKESKQRKSNGKPLQVAHHDTKYLTIALKPLQQAIPLYFNASKYQRPEKNRIS
ncbi:MAG: hypothetical protein A3J24_06195 [Deltaproteobacteria bacterium RIFCSPLOWO2_02_FULL_53_8]|nr:MAG: hypothetical protein A3J24_06195 [Deltaproteobacteria bacterium RIFCSPLOWO2_02_FULL_53_8]